VAVVVEEEAGVGMSGKVEREEKLNVVVDEPPPVPPPPPNPPLQD